MKLLRMDRLRYSFKFHHQRSSGMYYNNHAIMQHDLHVKLVEHYRLNVKHEISDRLYMLLAAVSHDVFFTGVVLHVQNHVAGTTFSTFCCAASMSHYACVCATIFHYKQVASGRLRTFQPLLSPHGCSSRLGQVL